MVACFCIVCSAFMLLCVVMVTNSVGVKTGRRQRLRTSATEFDMLVRVAELFYVVLVQRCQGTVDSIHVLAQLTLA